jgi:hypothetical protein
LKVSQLRASTLVSQPALTVIAVERVDLTVTRASIGGYCYASITPVAIIVCTPGRTYAVDIEANPVSVDSLTRDIPALSGILRNGSAGRTHTTP